MHLFVPEFNIRLAVELHVWQVVAAVHVAQ